MPEWMTKGFSHAPAVDPWVVVERLVLAAVLGWVIAWIYRRSRGAAGSEGSFPGTLVLLSILIAMVTQVIGDNVARAFSLVGALSIVRFRTVVRDTQDTAFVILAVVTGMAVGAQDLWVAFLGLAVAGTAAFVMNRRVGSSAGEGDADLPSELVLRCVAGLELRRLEREVFAGVVEGFRLGRLETVKQGLSLEVMYRVRLRAGADPQELVRVLNQTDGVQSVTFEVEVGSGGDR